MNYGTTFVILGVIFVGLGGYIGTLGWNLLQHETQRQAILRTLSAEWMVNAEISRDKKFTETDEQGLSKFVIFPRFQTTGLSATIASGLFVEEQDKLFLTLVFNLQEILADINRRLDFTEADMNEHPEKVAIFRKGIRDGQTLRNAKSRLKQLGELLLQDYGIQEEDQFFVELESPIE